jgi:ketosteroid isomerase-like protein
MSQEVQIEELAAAALEALNRRDPDALLALSHPEYEFRSRLVAVEGGVYSGPTGFQTYFRDLEESFTDMAWEMEEITDAPGDAFVVVMRFRGVGRESGVPFDFQTFQVWTLRDGKVSGNTVYASRDEALEAVGLWE